MNKWQIKDLKGVGDVELNLDSNQRVFTFLGTNGVGKTKTLEALYLSLFFQNKYIGNIKSTNEKILINEKSKGFLKLFSVLENSFYPLYVSFNYDDIDKSEVKSGYQDSYILVFLRANNRISLSKIERDLFDEMSEKELKDLQNNFFSLIEKAKLENQMPLLHFSDIHQWIIDRARFINPYQIEKDNSQIAIESVLQCLHNIDNAFDEKFLQIDENDNVYLKVNGEVLELSELSSGFLSLVKIIQSIIASFSAFTNEKDLLNVKGVVLIDEIESHLHLEWQVKIIPILKNLFPNTTFYITTHSPLVLSQLNEGEAYLLKRDEDNVVRSHIINSPNTRLLENVLQDAFGVNLNELKRQNMAKIDQSKAKKKLLDLLNSQVSQ